MLQAKTLGDSLLQQLQARPQAREPTSVEKCALRVKISGGPRARHHSGSSGVWCNRSWSEKSQRILSALFCIQGDDYQGLSNPTFDSYSQCMATAQGRPDFVPDPPDACPLRRAFAR